LVEDFKDLYSREELLIRFWHTYSLCEAGNTCGWFFYDNKNNVFAHNNSDNTTLEAKVQILNILLTALDIKNEDEKNKLLSEGFKLHEAFMK
jgi:hypothetical protein